MSCSTTWSGEACPRHLRNLRARQCTASGAASGDRVLLYCSAESGGKRDLRNRRMVSPSKDGRAATSQRPPDGSTLRARPCALNVRTAVGSLFRRIDRTMRQSLLGLLWRIAPTFLVPILANCFSYSIRPIPEERDLTSLVRRGRISHQRWRLSPRWLLQWSMSSFIVDGRIVIRRTTGLRGSTAACSEPGRLFTARLPHIESRFSAPRLTLRDRTNDPYGETGSIEFDRPGSYRRSWFEELESPRADEADAAHSSGKMFLPEMT